MSGLLIVMGLAVLPPPWPHSRRWLGRGLRSVGAVTEPALHLAAGIILAVVGLESMPEACAAPRSWR